MIQILVEERARKRKFGIRRHRWEDNIKRILKIDKLYNVKSCAGLKWRAAVDKVVNHKRRGIHRPAEALSVYKGLCSAELVINWDY
jgi:hypothetical protein